ncbi:MAG: prepilin-type N-terminal cleavage/methylation domain-containing protein [Candidatus Saccharimonadales bacterium]
MRKSILNKKGFTLLELLVVMLVMGILSLAIANFVTSWLQTSSENEAKANLLSTAESALTKVSNDIMLSGSVDTANRWSDPNGPSGNHYGWTSGSSTLVLAKVAVSSNGSAIFTDGSDYVTLKDDEVYFLSGTTLYRRTLSSGESGDSAVTTCPAAVATAQCPADNVIATGVTSWSVSYYDINGDSVTPANARSVQLSITISSEYGAKPITSSYTTRMVFRNN